jgi:hypothetical protein
VVFTVQAEAVELELPADKAAPLLEARPQVPVQVVLVEMAYLFHGYQVHMVFLVLLLADGLVEVVEEMGHNQA